MKTSVHRLVAIALTILVSACFLAAQTAEITYQGYLRDASGASFTGTAEIRFTLWDAAVNGAQVSATTPDSVLVPVADGLFSVPLRFGAGAFSGADRWLQIEVRTTLAPFTLLDPRQRITPAPYALKASLADGVSPGAITSGMLAPGAVSRLGSPNGVNAAVLETSDDGRVGIGTAAPAATIHATGAGAGLLLDGGVPGLPPKIELRGGQYDGPYGSILFAAENHTAELRFDEVTSIGSYAQLRLTIDNQVQATFGSGSSFYQVVSATSGMHVEQNSATPLFVNRGVNDGSLVELRTSGVTRGSISVAGSTVSYNAFTGSHYASTAGGTEPPPGTLVRLTGRNGRFGDDGNAEIVYGIEPTTAANDPACLGVLLGRLEPAEPPSSDNPILVAAVGNGDVWVTDQGGDLAPGDLLVSSDVEGCAMKDDPIRFATGHVIGRSAEAVNWARSAPDENGVRRRKISVLFDAFTRTGGAATAHQAELRRQAAELESLRDEVRSLRRELRPLAGPLPGHSADLDLNEPEPEVLSRR